MAEFPSIAPDALIAHAEREDRDGNRPEYELKPMAGALQR